jgi:fatty acid amide hydrolase
MESVGSIVTAVRTRAVRAADVLAEHVRRDRELHPRLNALVQRRAAAERVAAVLDTEPSGALAGVPVSVKECFPVRGLLTTLGVESRRHDADVHDAAIVTALEAAGAVVVGKGNVPQAMYLHETDNPVWGRSLHPADPDRSPGGSSGGDAALVAAGVVPLAVGNDLAGSLRQPAHSCGIAAIMPRSEAVGEGGAFRTMPHLSVVRTRSGFLARRAADLRQALAAIGRRDGTSGGTVRGLRIGWWAETGPVPAGSAITRAVAEAVERLAAEGADTVRLDAAPATEAAWLHLAILAADGGSHVRSLFGQSRPLPGVGYLLRMARLPRWVRPALARAAVAAGRRIEAQALTATGPLSTAAFARLLSRREAFAGRFALHVGGCDAIVCPVSAVPALRHGTGARLLLAASPCLLANLLDLPAGAVPVTTVRQEETVSPLPSSRDPVVAVAAECHRGSAGLPVGVQVLATPGGDESVVLDVMEAIERPAGG